MPGSQRESSIASSVPGASDPARIGLRRSVDDLTTRWAVPARLECRAAGLVMKRFVFAAGPFTRSAPVGEQSKRTRKRPAFDGEAILEPGWPLDVSRGRQQAVGLETPETIGQDVWRDAWYGSLKVPVAQWTGQQRLHDPRAPAIADPIQCSSQWRGIVRSGKRSRF